MGLKSALAWRRRHKINNAETLNSDLEFAFDLQMEEALTASLGVLNLPPSTATSSSSSSSSENADIEPPSEEEEDGEEVTGRVQPQDSEISTLVNQFSFLHKKFEDLIECLDINFAIRFARDAMVSQITWPAETSKGKEKLETCVICYEDRDVDQIFSVDGCFHRYCFSCMKQHVEVKLLNGTMAKCPHEGCKSEVSIETCGKFLDPKLVEIMSQRKKEASIAVREKVYCPYPRCSALMSKSEVLKDTNSFSVGGEKCGARKCVQCNFFFCIHCRVPWHYYMTCYDYKRSNTRPRKEDAMLDTLAKRNLWRQCVKCSHMVELAEGCYHITCRCGHEFCYSCGAVWKNKNPTCKCPIWDEQNIIRDRRML